MSPSSPGDDAEMFDLAPVSLWLEDYSALKQQFQRWRDEGVVDLRAYLQADRGRIAACSALIRLVKVNRRTLALYEAESLGHLQANLHRVFRADMLDRHTDELVRLWDGHLGFSGQTVNYTLGGQRLDIVLNATILPGHEADWSRVLLSIEDITPRVQAEQYAKGLFEHSPVSLWVEDFSGIKRLLEEVRDSGITDFRTFTDVHPEFVERCMQEIRVIDVNQQTLAMFQASSLDVLLRNLSEVFRDDMRASFNEQLIDLWNGKTFQQREVVNYTIDGEKLHVYLQFSVLPGHEADWDLVLVSLTDITARKKAEAYLEFLGKHDALTKLRNRSFFGDEMNRLERRGPWPVTVAVLDLNGLKEVNDDQGHAAGDALLRRAGEVLAKVVDRGMCAARIGGDEFALLMPGTDERGGQELLRRVQELTDLNNQYHGRPKLMFAMGAATCRHGQRLENALHDADVHMYASKRDHYDRRENDRRGRAEAAIG